MKRFNERKQDFYNALDRLQEALNEEPTDIIIKNNMPGKRWQI